MYNSNSDNANNWCWKFPGKTFLRDFNILFSKMNLVSWKKMALHIFTLIQYKARQVLYAIYLVLTREMAQDWHLWHEVLKSTSNMWKPWFEKLWLGDFIQETIWRNQLYSHERYKPLRNFGRNLTWAYELKALKSYS